ncbi:hypothetical protein ACJQWY_03815 [Weissella kandleri]|uniref:hypothetical protein n=1 Tax=Weissella kandleri TaxID=1616 RepID=UPI00387E97FA
MELPLTATVLNKRSGITIVGSVGDAKANVTVQLADQTLLTPEIDESGSFIVQVDWQQAHGDIKIVASLPDDPTTRNETTLHIEAPQPIVTAVLSTQGIMRKLTGSVNQPGLFIEVHTPENAHPIEVLVDDNLEFELQIPIALRPEDLRVTALNPVTGEQLEVPVEIGVTTKTMTIPILTDEMINSYAEAAEERRAASEAHDQALVDKAAASESFVNSIVEGITPSSAAVTASIVAENKQATEKADVPVDEVPVAAKAPETNGEATEVKASEQAPVEPVKVIVEVLQPRQTQTQSSSTAEQEIAASEAEATPSVATSKKDEDMVRDEAVSETLTTEFNLSDFDDGDEKSATETGVAEVLHDGGIKTNRNIEDPRAQTEPQTNYSRTSRNQEVKPKKKGGFWNFLKRLFGRG